MTRLLMYAGGLVAVAASSAEISFESVQLPGINSLNMAFAAALGPHLSVRDWTVTIAVLIFAAFNVFLWTLPISQTDLFLITFPLGIAALLAFMWFAPRR